MDGKDFSQFLHPEVAELFEEHYKSLNSKLEELSVMVANLQDTNDFIFKMIDDVYEDLKKSNDKKIVRAKPSILKRIKSWFARE